MVNFLWLSLCTFLDKDRLAVNFDKFYNTELLSSIVLDLDRITVSFDKLYITELVLAKTQFKYFRAYSLDIIIS